jgi:hypothetical protein
MENDKRGDYRSILPGTQVVCRAAPVRPQDRHYLVGVAENLSLGGLFLSTRHPLPVGTLVMLDVYPGEGADRAPCSARAIVRWRQRWREPRGMGLQFLEFTNLAHRPIPELLDQALSRPPAWRLPGAPIPA